MIAHDSYLRQLLERIIQRNQVVQRNVDEQDSNRIFCATGAGVVSQSIDGISRRHFFILASSVALSPGGDLLAMSENSTVAFCDLRSDRLLARLPSRVSEFPSPTQGAYGTLAFSPNGKHIAMTTGFRLGIARVRSDLKAWDVETRQEIGAPLFKSEVGLRSVDFSPDSRSLVVADTTGLIRIWNTSTWEVVDTWSGMPGVYCIKVSRTGNLVALGTTNGIVIYEFPSGKKLHVIRQQSATSVEFSNDGRTLLTTANGGRVVMWNVASGLESATIRTDSNVFDGKFSPDGTKIAACGDQGRMWLWKVPTLAQATPKLPLPTSCCRCLANRPLEMAPRRFQANS